MAQHAALTETPKTQAAVAQDYVKTLTLTTSSGDHSPVEMVLTLRKTIIKFDVEIPDEVLTVKAPEVLMKNDSVGDIEPIVGQVVLRNFLPRLFSDQSVNRP